MDKKQKLTALPDFYSGLNRQDQINLVIEMGCSVKPTNITYRLNVDGNIIHMKQQRYDSNDGLSGIFLSHIESLSTDNEYFNDICGKYSLLVPKDTANNPQNAINSGDCLFVKQDSSQMDKLMHEVRQQLEQMSID